MNDYETLAKFWDDAFAEKQEDNGALPPHQELAPAPELFEVLQGFAGKTQVLDYGCGSGWASIIMAKEGAKHVLACDVSANGVARTEEAVEAYAVKDIVTTEAVDLDWLSKQVNRFDGFFCSNVLDVVPSDMAKAIVADCAKACRPGARVVFSFNFYMDPEAMKSRGFEVEDRNVYAGGVLRLVALKDEEWKQILAEHFVVEDLWYFAWPGEAKKTRRLFILRKEA